MGSAGLDPGDVIEQSEDLIAATIKANRWERWLIYGWLMKRQGLFNPDALEDLPIPATTACS